MLDLQFDNLSRAIASGISRRDLLRFLTSSTVGLLANSFLPANAREVAAQGTPQECGALRNYPTAGTRFTGANIQADIQFFGALDSINACASVNNVFVVVTSSFRTSAPPNPIVPPAQRSNHFAGHAIDMNVQYTDANNQLQLCNSTCLRQITLPAPVASFIQCVRNSGVRYGGDFTFPDVVHFDDGLNLQNDAYVARVKAVQDICDSGGPCCNTVCCNQGQTCINGMCSSCNGATCGGFASCGPGLPCVCFTGADGGGVCARGDRPLCNVITPCTSSSQCGPGFACAVNTCCGASGVCVELCSSGVSAALIQSSSEKHEGSTPGRP